MVDLDDDRADPDHLRRLLDFAVALGFDALNVTHPVKQAMVPLVDQVTADVEAIGALNTVLIRDGRPIGHNTDVTGFDQAFRDGLPDAPLARCCSWAPAAPAPPSPTRWLALGYAGCWSSTRTRSAPRTW